MVVSTPSFALFRRSLARRFASKFHFLPGTCSQGPETARILRFLPGIGRLTSVYVCKPPRDFIPALYRLSLRVAVKRGIQYNDTFTNPRVPEFAWNLGTIFPNVRPIRTLQRNVLHTPKLRRSLTMSVLVPSSCHSWSLIKNISKRSMCDFRVY